MNPEANENVRVKYYIDRKSFWAQAAVTLMLISAVFRIIGCWGMWKDPAFAWTQIVLPISCNVLFALCVVLLGGKGFFLSALPVLLGVVFFIIKSFGFASKIHMVLCILLYLIVAVLYTGTVTGSIRTKWLLPPLFGLPFLYHIFVEDLPAISNEAVQVTFSAGMQEISVLCVMSALFCTGMGLKKRKAETMPELPKIADPIVVVPEKSAVPEQCDAPENSVVPEQCDAPEKSAVPEQCDVPEKSAGPEQCDAPEKSAEPENPAAEQTAEAPEQDTGTNAAAGTADNENAEAVPQEKPDES